MFMDWKTQCYKDVSSSQTDLLILSNPKQNHRKVCVCVNVCINQWIDSQIYILDLLWKPPSWVTSVLKNSKLRWLILPNTLSLSESTLIKTV